MLGKHQELYASRAPNWRSVIALDGEGWSPEGVGGEHWYTLLNAYDSRMGRHRYISAWKPGGLSTEYILEFLMWLRKSRTTIVCGFFLNYDITMWLRDLSDEEKTALWSSGWLVWRGPQRGRWYWLEYIPSKLFFCGQYEPTMGLTCEKFKWPAERRSVLIYDVSGFSQKSFVKTLTDWQAELGVRDDELADLQRMKDHRGTFTPGMIAEVEAYNRSECYWLSRYVQELHKTFHGEGIWLDAWHGAGALATWYLKKYHVEERMGDHDHEAVRTATLSSYFGGRTELCVMGHFRSMRNYDLNSAYPTATLLLPDVLDGVWQFSCDYCNAPYALWHVQWNVHSSSRRMMPFPVRYHHDIYYPDSGEGWYHACEVAAAKRVYGDAVVVDYGWVYTPHCPDVRPFAFVRDVAGRRLAFKLAEDKRAVVYKYVLNSLYGKLAQHSAELGKKPLFQSYYAAGFVTAWCRARLLDFVFQAGHDDRDVMMLATDGVFCEKERSAYVGDALGEFQAQPTLSDVYIVQPGVWYTAQGSHKTRGFGAKTLDYKQIRQAWESDGVWSHIPYTETRFVGLGACAGRGDYSQYGRWVEQARELQFYPTRKFVVTQGRSERVTLSPVSMAGKESEAYVPLSPRDERSAVWLYNQMSDLVDQHDQPDME